MDTQSPSRMLYQESDFAGFPPAKRLLMETFVKDLEKHLGVPRTKFDITEEWNAKAPKDCARPIQEYLKTVSAAFRLP
jgi:hypothetical protein